MTSVLDRLSRLSTREQVRNWLGLGRTTQSFTVGPFSVQDGEQEVVTVTLAGAEVGDFVEASLDADLNGITLTAYVQSPDTVATVFNNGSDTPGIGIPESTLRVRLKDS